MLNESYLSAQRDFWREGHTLKDWDNLRKEHGVTKCPECWTEFQGEGFCSEECSSKQI